MIAYGEKIQDLVYMAKLEICYIKKKFSNDDYRTISGVHIVVVDQKDGVFDLNNARDLQYSMEAENGVQIIVAHAKGQGRPDSLRKKLCNRNIATQ